MKRKLRIGGLFTGERGLRYIPVNAKALDYDIVMVDLFSHKTDLDPLEVDRFRSMSYGLQLSIRLNYSLEAGEIHSPIYWSQLHSAYDSACALGADYLVIKMGESLGESLGEVSTEVISELEKRLGEFKAKVRGDYDLKILFQVSCKEVEIYRGVCRRLGEAYGLCINSLEPTHIFLTLDLVEIVLIEPLKWESYSKEPLLSRYIEWGAREGTAFIFVSESLGTQASESEFFRKIFLSKQKALLTK